MAKTDFKTVDAYLAAQPQERRAVLDKVRATIVKALPAAEERISYQIPSYRLHGETVIYFAGWKDHFSLYPIGEKTVEAFGDALAPYEANRKGTLRFPLTGRVPTGLIAKLVKFRAKEAKDNEARKKAGARRSRS